VPTLEEEGMPDCKCPIRSGTEFVASLAHPGANITGFTNFEYALGGKWPGLLREIAPGLARVAVIQNPGDQDSSEYLGAVKAAARSVGLQAISDDVRDDAEIEVTYRKLGETIIERISIRGRGLAAAIDLISAVDALDQSIKRPQFGVAHRVLDVFERLRKACGTSNFPSYGL
jgi:hypothetical protein